MLVFVFVFVVVRGEALRARNMLVRRVIRHLVSVRIRLRTSIYNARGISMRGDVEWWRVRCGTYTTAVDVGYRTWEVDT